MYTHKAYSLAKKAHEGQFRRDGTTPYFSHPVAVAEQFMRCYPNEEHRLLVAIALLHDVLEDNKEYKPHHFREIGIPEKAIEAVVLLTRSDEPGEDYLSYLLRLKDNELARKVKIEDIKHNLQTSSGNQKEKYLLALYILGEK